MTETSTTTTRCTPDDRVFAIANARLAEHMLEHHLPYPTGIYAALSEGHPAVIEFSVHSETRQAAWLATLEVDAVTTEPRRSGEVRASWAARLPDGTRVRMSGLREADAPGPELVGDVMRRELTVLHGRREVRA